MANQKQQRNAADKARAKAQRTSPSKPKTPSTPILSKMFTTGSNSHGTNRKQGGPRR